MIRTDIDNWSPISVMEIHNLFSETPIVWCIAGGWALDLFLGRKSREHSDIDVLIFREDQQVVYEYLQKNWKLYKAENGKLLPWEAGEYLKSTNDVWVSKNGNSPWAFQIMLVDSENNEWVYRREKSIRKEKGTIFLKTPDGLPYLRPEIQLLYKGGSSNVREKDHKDFQTILPYLLPKQKLWLKNALMTQASNGHDWVRYL